MGELSAKAAVLVSLLAISPALGQPPEATALPDTALDGHEGGGGEPAGADGGGEGEEAYEEPSPQLWMETYAEGVYSRHEQDNASGFTDVKIGKRFGLGLPLDVYAKARMHRDQRDFFWNNHLDAGAGVRVNLLKGAALLVYAEAMGGYYYRTDAAVGNLSGLQARIDRNRAAMDAAQARLRNTYRELANRVLLEEPLTLREMDSLSTTLDGHSRDLQVLDLYIDSLETAKDSLVEKADSLALIPSAPLREYRAGFMFWYGRGQAEGGDRRALRFSPRFWCDLYADGTFSSLRRGVLTRGGGSRYYDSTARFTNFILYANPDVGVNLLEGAGGGLIAYATLYAWFDTHRDWWNNRAMAGPGLRLKPLKDFDLVMGMEYLWGAYYGREREEDPNPYRKRFQDIRLLASFWYGLGF